MKLKYKTENNLLVKNKQYNLIFALALFPYFVPLSFLYIINIGIDIDMLFHYIRLLESIIIIIYFLNYKKIQVRTLLVVFFSALYVFISMITSIKWDATIFFALNITAIFLLFKLASRKKSLNIEKVLFNLLFLFVVINLILLIIYPEGVYRLTVAERTAQDGYWTWTEYRRINFLEGDNAMMGYMIPLWLSSILCWYDNLISKKLVIIAVIIIDLNIILIWSVTSMLGCLALTVGTILIMKGKSLLNKVNMACMIIAMNVVFVVFQIQTHFQSFFQRLGKDVTFTGRTEIWHQSFNLFIKSPLVGYGTKQHGYIINGSATHNIWLTVLIRGGILLFMLFILVLLYNIPRKSNDISYPKIQGVYFAVFAFLIMGTFETIFDQFGFWVTIAMSELIYNRVYSTCTYYKSNTIIKFSKGRQK